MHNNIRRKGKGKLLKKVYEYLQAVHKYKQGKTEYDLLDLLKAEPWDDGFNPKHIYRKIYRDQVHKKIKMVGHNYAPPNE